MLEHTIRLRAGWQIQEAGAHPPSALTLPVVWPAERAALVRLIRPFHPPRIDLDRESLLLRLEATPGLVSLRLDGLDLVSAEGIARPSLEIELGRLPAGRVELTLDLDLAAAAAAATAPDAEWGRIALIIRQRPTPST